MIVVLQIALLIIFAAEVEPAPWNIGLSQINDCCYRLNEMCINTCKTDSSCPSDCKNIYETNGEAFSYTCTNNACTFTTDSGSSINWNFNGKPPGNAWKKFAKGMADWSKKVSSNWKNGNYFGPSDVNIDFDYSFDNDDYDGDNGPDYDKMTFHSEETVNKDIVSLCAHGDGYKGCRGGGAGRRGGEGGGEGSKDGEGGKGKRDEGGDDDENEGEGENGQAEDGGVDCGL